MHFESTSYLIFSQIYLRLKSHQFRKMSHFQAEFDIFWEIVNFIGRYIYEKARDKTWFEVRWKAQTLFYWFIQRSSNETYMIKIQKLHRRFVAPKKNIFFMLHSQLYYIEKFKMLNFCCWPKMCCHEKFLQNFKMTKYPNLSKFSPAGYLKPWREYLLRS